MPARGRRRARGSDVALRALRRLAGVTEPPDDAWGLAAAVHAGEVTRRALIDAAFARIDDRDPAIRAFVRLRRAGARAEADAADAAGEQRPLEGVPIAIKDDTDVAGLPTRFGSLATSDAPAAADATVVRRLREAGAIVVGKTALPELAIWPWTETVASGVTRNPWDTARSPGGSSGGSAAAVAAGLVPLALASDGAGSIRIPAAWCGLVGLRPQTGRIPMDREGWNGLSGYGPLARTVRDAALFLDVAAASGDRYRRAAAMAPRRLRIAVSTKPPVPVPVDREIVEAVEWTAALLEGFGHEIVRRDPPITQANARHMTIRYLGGIRADVDRVRAEAAADGRPATLERRTRSLRRLAAPAVPRLVEGARRGDRSALDRFFGEFDLLLTPTTAQMPPRVGRYAGASGPRALLAALRLTAFPATWNHTGQPTASMPAGRSRTGLPLAVQLIARPDDEETLLAVMAQVETARPVWRATVAPPRAGTA